MRKLSILFFLTLTIFTTSCGGDEVTGGGDNFDRKAMLENWADNIILPAYQEYVNQLAALSTAKDEFLNDKTIINLESLRSAWLDANLAWQAAGFFEVGMAEQLTLVNYTNIYPTNVTDLRATIEAGTYDLTAISKQDEQGFPAIEYLIYGMGTDQGIIDTFSGASGENYSTYLSDLVDRLSTLATTVLSDWENGYRDTFVNNAGSDASSSVNKLTNFYLAYYERHLRAGKIGYPAGVFSTTTLPESVEGRYSGASKLLFNASLDAMQDFFNGVYFDGTGSGESLRSYLDFLNTFRDGEALADLIDGQFDIAREKAALLSDSFYDQVTTNNTRMLETYDALQANVVYMKVDMMQAMSINVNIPDNDGD